MARYSILYFDPTNRPGEQLEHHLEAASDAQARIRFMNLSWVAFTTIWIGSIAVASDQPEEAKEAAKASRTAGVPPHAYLGNGAGCRHCGEGMGHKLHDGFEATMETPPDRTNTAVKQAAAAIKAAAAGITAPTADVAVLKARAVGKTEVTPAMIRRAASPPPKVIPTTDWRKDVDHLTDRIGKLADRAQSLTRRGRHAEADELRKEARELAASRAAITKRNKGKS